MPDLEYLAAYGDSPSWMAGIEPGVAGASSGLQLAANIRGVGLPEVLSTFQHEIGLIRRDDTKSPKGQAAAMRDLAKVKAAKLETFRAPVKALKDDHARQLAALDQTTELTAADAVFMVATWGYLPADALAVREAYAAAVDAGDLRTARAIEALPTVHGGRPSTAEINTMRRERLAAEFPAEAQEIARLDDAISDLETCLATAERQIGEAAPADAVADAA